MERERAAMLALRHAVEADRDRAQKVADLGVELRALRGTPEFRALLRATRDSGVVSMVELARLIGVGRTRLYELLAEDDDR